MKDNVLIVGANIGWIQRKNNIVNGTRLQVQSGGCSVNVNWSRILSEFARLLKELRIGKEKGIYSIHKSSKFMLHCNCTSFSRSPDLVVVVYSYFIYHNKQTSKLVPRHSKYSK